MHEEIIQQSDGVLRKDNCTVCGTPPAKCSKIKKSKNYISKKIIQSINLFLLLCFMLWVNPGLLFLCTAVCLSTVHNAQATLSCLQCFPVVSV